MSKIINPVSTSDTFQVWLQRTNDLVNELGTSIVTASSLGDTTVGNAILIGDFTANNVTGNGSVRTNVIDTKVGNTSPIDFRGSVDFSSSIQTSVSVTNSLGPRIRVRNNNIAWLMGVRGSTGTGTNAQFVIGVEGTNFALRIGTDGTVYANNIILDTESSSASSAVRSSRTISTNNGLTGGGDLTANRTFGLTGNALALHNLTATGLIVRTGTNSLSARTIESGTGIAVSNGAGVAGNPSIAIDQTVVATVNTTQTITGIKTFSSTIRGSITGNANTVTGGVYTSGNQTISGVKSFNDAPIIGTTSDGSGGRTEVLVRSQGYAGIKINGDVSNLSGEPGGSYVSFAVDGTGLNGVVGISQTTDVGPDGTSVTGVTGNSLVVGTYTNVSTHIVADSKVVATFGALGNLTVSGNITASSDARLKTNITTVDDALDKVTSMRGVYFERDGKRNVGVIAQEIEAVLPEVVHTEQSEYKSVAYGNIIGVLIEAIKELKAKVDYLESKE